VLITISNGPSAQRVVHVVSRISSALHEAVLESLAIREALLASVSAEVGG